MSESPTQKPALKYRPDIDGLRAVAILSVVAFHMSLGMLPGGFVGVDVFFVISGYLISAIVFAEIADSRFSVAAFYERRIRRIFPALFAMLILFSIVVSFCLLPTEFVGYAKSVLAATASVSNFYFWQHSGYFDSPTSNPLLHTWSLAVEEQFYILFPIFLVVIRRFFPQRMRIAVVVLFFASLAAGIVTVHFSPVTAFYMPYTRAWELLLGTIVSLGMFPRLHSSLMRNIATLSGMGMIVFSLFAYHNETPFPGIAAIPPCLGSALIIGSGQFGTSLVGRVLSWRPVVFIGLISYSFYLWHWPVIVLETMGFSISMDSVLPHRLLVMLPPLRMDGLRLAFASVTEVAVSFLLAVLSWRFVERPFRSRPLRISRRPLFALSAATMAALFLFAGSVIFAGGFTSRFSPRAVQVASYLAIHDAGKIGNTGGCFSTFTRSSEPFDNDRCLRPAVGKKNYLLIGDSHAAALWSGLSSVLPDESFLLASGSNCKPFIHAANSPGCQAEMNYIFHNYLESHTVQALLLQAKWTRMDMGGLAETVDWATQHKIPVIVIGPVAQYDAPLPRLLAYSIAWNKPDLASRHRTSLSSALDAQMQRLAANTWHVPYISLYQAICVDRACAEYADAAHQVPLMTDGEHLTDAGSAFVVERLISQGEMHWLTGGAIAVAANPR